MSGCSSRWAARLLLLLLIAVGLLLTAVSPAAAHPALVSSEPGAGYALTSPPARVVLRFSEPVSLPRDPLVVQPRGAQPVDLVVTADSDGAALVGTPRSPLPVGAYEVSYRVVGQDGDLISGTFSFGVGTPAAAAAAGAVGGGAPDRVQPGTALLRGLLFLGLAGALGGLFLAWRLDVATGGLPGVRPLARTGALVALAGAGGLLVALGPPGALLQRVAAPGPVQLLAGQVALLLLAALSAHRPLHGALAGASLLGVVAIEAARAHPYAAAGVGGAALTVVHLLAGALWLGGLVHALRQSLAWRDRPQAVRVAVTTYARSAVVLAVLVAGTGTVSALTLLPSPGDWTGTTYGRLLLGKLALVVLVLAAAALARRHLRRRGEAAPPVRWRRPAGLEVALLAATVLAAAAVTSVTPASMVPVSTLLAAPEGPVLRVAERVNQVTVAAVASQGRLDLRTEAPDDGRPLRVRVTGAVVGAEGRQPLELSSCGAACWTAPVDWADGTSTLELDVDAGRWKAGGTRLPVTWPAVPAPDLLGSVRRAMQESPVIDTVETVTSGFGVVVPSTSRRDSRQFLEAQPWADGGAADAVLETSAGRRTLRFALPSLGYHFALELDAADRIVSERIVTPNHLLTRRYSYP